MDINDLFEGIAKAARQYQAEVAEENGMATEIELSGLGPKAEPEKTEKKEESEKQNCPEFLRLE